MKKAHSLLALSTLSIVATASAHTTALPHAHYEGESTVSISLIALGLGLAAAAYFARRLFKAQRQKVGNR